MPYSQSSPLNLRLADGRHWLIRATDPAAASILTALGEAMQLKPGRQGRELLVAVSTAGFQPPADPQGDYPLACTLAPPDNHDLLTVAMINLGLVIAQEAQQRGGVLLHGALAAYPGVGDSARETGLILAGPSDIGKSTASRRLPPPWRPLCDDATLIVRDPQGQYWAHPMPTWSRFFSYSGDPPPGGRWNTQEAVPLGALFLLNQAPEDRITPLNPAETTALLMESCEQITRVLAHRLGEDARRRVFHREQLANVRALVTQIPAYRLDLSLTGTFWREIEAILASTPAPPPPVQERPASPPLARLQDELQSWMVYTGPSMNPTLIEPDLLELKPCGDRPLQVGDVIAFQTPVKDRPVVHRVIRVTPEGVHTRGDNNSADDPYRVRPEEIFGRVIAVRRGQRRRTLAGGWLGQWQAKSLGPRRLARQWVLFLPRYLYRAIARTGLIRRLLPAAWRPRVIVFTARHRTLAKLMLGHRVIGSYNYWQENWRITRPFELLVETEGLPRFTGFGIGDAKAQRKIDAKAQRRKGAQRKIKER